MTDLEQRLSDFKVRGFGGLPISFSWGVADATASLSLRQALDDCRPRYVRTSSAAATCSPAFIRAGNFPNPPGGPGVLPHIPV